MLAAVFKVIDLAYQQLWIAAMTGCFTVCCSETNYFFADFTWSASCCFEIVLASTVAN